jgi:hypothetical protein
MDGWMDGGDCAIRWWVWSYVECGSCGNGKEWIARFARFALMFMYIYLASRHYQHAKSKLTHHCPGHDLCFKTTLHNPTCNSETSHQNPLNAQPTYA